MNDFFVTQKVKVKINKQTIKDLKKGKKTIVQGFGLCSGDGITTKIKPLKNGSFKISPVMFEDNPVFEVDTVKEVIEMIKEIYGSGKHYA